MFRPELNCVSRCRSGDPLLMVERAEVNCVQVRADFDRLEEIREAVSDLQVSGSARKVLSSDAGWSQQGREDKARAAVALAYIHELLSEMAQRAPKCFKDDGTVEISINTQSARGQRETYREETGFAFPSRERRQP
jgi:hypothetical protein